VNQLLHDLAVDVLPDLTETAQLEEAAGGDTSNMLTECQLGVNKRVVWQIVAKIGPGMSKIWWTEKIKN